MNRCPNETIIAAYVDQMLEASEMERMEVHLLRCGRCLASVWDLRAMHVHANMAVPEATVQRALALVPANSGKTGWVLPLLGPVRWMELAFLSTTLVVAAALAGFMVGRSVSDMARAATLHPVAVSWEDWVRRP